MWLIASAAYAASCCVGSTTSLPLRVGGSEQAVVGLTGAAEVGLARWDRAGAVVGSGLAEQAASVELGAGLRLGGQWQVGLALPARFTHRAASVSEGSGGGVGDLRAAALWEPVAENVGGSWVPVVRGGVRVPTGRDWTESEAVLLQDVTGLQGTAGLIGVQIERLQGGTPAFVGLQGELGSADDRLQPVLSPSIGVGRSLSERWTVLGSFAWTASWAPTSATGGFTARPTAGARLVHGGDGWRGWISARCDVPVPGLGRSVLQLGSLGGGLAKVF